MTASVAPEGDYRRFRVLVEVEGVFDSFEGTIMVVFPAVPDETVFELTASYEFKKGFIFETVEQSDSQDGISYRLQFATAPLDFHILSGGTLREGKSDGDGLFLTLDADYTTSSQHEVLFRIDGETRTARIKSERLEQSTGILRLDEAWKFSK